MEKEHGEGEKYGRSDRKQNTGKLEKTFKTPIIKSTQRVQLTSADSSNTVTREEVYSSMPLTVNTEVKTSRKKRTSKGKDEKVEAPHPTSLDELGFT